jgi:hypothetical protein
MSQDYNNEPTERLVSRLKSVYLIVLDFASGGETCGFEPLPEFGCTCFKG